ncbi:MAG TPA: GAF domain-containing protein [Microlunatus sp.]|nr:GAF domain-containing protein [Microlunatus sp.]
MGQPDQLAMPPGADPRQLSRHLGALHDTFVSSGSVDPALRPVVSDSWRRSVRSGLDPERSLAQLRLDEARLAEARATHPLAIAMPVIRRLLVEEAAEAGLLVAVSDAAGQLLWVEGDPVLRAKAETMHFLPGADWSEDSAGTNAPGTALALGRPVQIFGPEHLLRPVTPWSCSAAPIREPDTGAILGVLDLTGGPEVAGAQTLALVRATVAAVEAELRLSLLTGAYGAAAERRDSASTTPRLEVLGRRSARFSYPGTTTELSLRHSEIVLLLADSPDGLSSAELGVALSDDDQALVTIRAELSRLRTQLGPVPLESRPYRLPRLTSDIDDLRADLLHGRLRSAVARYRGPVLPASRAPGVEQLRDDLHRQLRGRLLAGSDPDALLAFADTPYGREDFDVWARVLTVLPPSSSRFPEVSEHLLRLDLDLR